MFFRAKNRSTFTCPFCYQSNFDNKGLLQHVNNNHKSERQSVVSNHLAVYSQLPLCGQLTNQENSELEQFLYDREMITPERN